MQTTTNATGERGQGASSVALPPEGAVTLFDGRSLEGWRGCDERPATWKVRDGYLEVVPGAGDIVSGGSFRGFQLHLEFWLPHMPYAVGQDRANSGIFFAGRYELQILDSFGCGVAEDSCGALYKLHAPLRNACREPEVWQTLEVAFRAPRLDTNGFVADPARLTAFMNGVLIHNNVVIEHPTEASLDSYEAQPGPLRLQEHGCAVRYRNIWILP